MDPVTLFVNEFCNRLATIHKGMRQLQAYYVFSDKRPGSITERYTADAEDHMEFSKLLGVRNG
jgi:hypothetical protein